MLRRWNTPAGGPELRLLAVLLLTLGLTALLAHQAQQAVRSQREVAQAALRDYAAFASWELGRRLEDAMALPLTLALTHARVAPEITFDTSSGPVRETSSLARFRSAVIQGLEICRCEGAIHDVFVVDLESGWTARSDRRLPESFDAWLQIDFRSRAGTASASGVAAPSPHGRIRSFRTDAAPPDTGGPARTGITVRRSAMRIVEAFEVLDVDAYPNSRVLFTILRDPLGRVDVAYGFVLDVNEYAAGIAEEVVERAEVLPPSLTRGRRNPEILVIRVLGLNDVELYQTQPSPDLFGIVVDTIDTSFAQMVTEVAVRPALANTLVIGGLPRSRLPLLVVLFLIALVLSMVGMVQLRRQHALSRLRRDFVTGVSHELRTPLTQISMFAELLESGRLDEGGRQRSTRIINQEAQRLRHLVENVLQFSRAGRVDRDMARIRTDIAALVQDVAEGFTLFMHGLRASLRVDVDPNLVATLDPHAARQVLLNLLDNAVKYGPPEQSIVLTAYREERAIVLAVEDEGPGIGEAEREEVWKPYRRLTRHVESGVAGSGIGLAVVRELVARHGGTAHVEDAAGGGARFVVTFPADDAGAPRAATAPTPPHLTTEPP